MTKANHSSQHRSDIQAFRGVAVIAVILFHAFPTVCPKGYLGVDLFFVISGFVMTPQIVRIFQRENDSDHYIFPKLRAFYIRRFYRLAPAFGVFVLFTCVIVFLFGNIADHARFTMQGIYSILLFGNVGALRFSGDYFNPNPNPLVHLWSLSTEEQIYFFIPLYLFACISFFRIKIFSENLFKKFVLVAMCLCFVIFYLSTHVISVLAYFHLSQLSWILSNPFSYYSPFHRLIEFSIGAIAASTQLNPSISQSKHITNVKIVVELILVVLLFYPGNVSVSENVLELTICTSMAILIQGSSRSTKWDKILIPLVWCGDRSYSLYLYHLPLIYLVQFGLFSRVNLPSSILTTTAILAAAFMASATYRSVEQPNRVRGSRIRIGGALDSYFTRSLVIYFLLPLILLVSMNLAGNYKYFGLNRNPDPPSSAATLDPNCRRESLSGGPCIYSSSNKSGSVLLIGDSHAGMLSQIIVDEARKAHWESVIWTHNGYPPRLQDAKDFTLNPYSDLSVTNTIAQVKWIESNKPDIVVISALLITRDQPLFRNAVTYFSKIAKRVIVINETPLFTDARFFSSYSILEKPYIPKKSIPLSEMNQSAFTAGEKFSVWAQLNNIETVDTVDLFCDKAQCTRFNNSGWLYFDNSHLSVAGAQLLGPRLRALFQESNK